VTAVFPTGTPAALGADHDGFSRHPIFIAGDIAVGSRFAPFAAFNRLKLRRLWKLRLDRFVAVKAL
jgi:hypothetical protein